MTRERPGRGGTEPMSITADQVRAFRLERSGLTGGAFATPEDVAAALGGVQAQILSAAGLALWNRCPRFTLRRLESLLMRRRTLVKIWGQRGTLHLYPAPMWPLVHGALSGRPTWQERSLAARGGDVAAWRTLVQRVAGLLAERGVIGRQDLRATGWAFDDDALSSWGGIFADLVRQGIACHAGSSGNEGLFAHRQTWLPRLVWAPPDRLTANGALLERYLATYGPATLADFAYWRGSSQAEARRWLTALGDRVATVQVEGMPMLACRADLDWFRRAPVPSEGDVRLLGRFEPLLLAQRDKSFWVPSRFHHRVWRPAGHIEATVLGLRGQVIGTWRYARSDAGVAIAVRPFGRLAASVVAGLERQAVRVARFFGVPLTRLDCWRAKAA